MFKVPNCFSLKCLRLDCFNLRYLNLDCFNSNILKSIHLNLTTKKLISFILSYIIIYLQIFFSYSVISYTFNNNAYANTHPSTPSIVIDSSVSIPSVNNNTHLDTTLNGTPLININSANGQGISANYYKDFNIDDRNLILNNYKGESINTKLGGVIYGNPNFNANNGKEANIILNEITTNRISNINGYLEVAGKKADVIIANPNGIMVGGAGFINVNRLSMINGRSLDKTTNSSFNNNNGTLNPFIITDTNSNPNAIIQVIGKNITDENGNIIAYNLGIDAQNINYMDMVSRIIKINGNIIGNIKDNTTVDNNNTNTTEINLKTGNNKAIYDSKDGFVVSSKNNESNDYNNNEDNNNQEETQQTNNNPKPEFAIDSTAFGGVYAGRINFIATEDGVGVRSRGDLIATVDDLNFDLNGNLIFEDNSTAYSNNDVNINVKNGDVINTDSTLIANHNININANNLINKGTDNIDIDTDPYLATQKHSYYYGKAGTNETKMIGLDTYTSTLTSNSSVIQAGNDLNINTNDSITNHNSILYSNNNINLSTNTLNNTITEFAVKETEYWQWKEKIKHTYDSEYRYHNWNVYNDLLLTTSTPSIIKAKNLITIEANEINNGVNNSNNINNNGNIPYSPINIKIDHYNSLSNDISNIQNNLHETDPTLTDNKSFIKTQYYKTRMGGLDLYNMDSKYLRNNYIDNELTTIQLQLNSLLQNTNSTVEYDDVNGTTITGNNIIIKSRDGDQTSTLNNGGTIKANDTLIIENIDTINNVAKAIDRDDTTGQPTLSAGNTLIIDTGANGTVNNLSGVIEVDNSTNNNTTNNLLYINTGALNNITLSQQETRSFNAKNYEYTNIETNIGDTATIRSNNSDSNIILNAKDDINIMGGDIKADNDNSNINLTTTDGDINITTIQDYSYTRQYSKTNGGTFGTTTARENINESVNNIQSNITASNNIFINSGNNLNSIGTNITSYGDNGSINLNVTNDLNIYNAMDSVYSYMYEKKEKFDVASALTNIAVAVAVGALTGGAGAAAMAGLASASGAANMSKGSVKTSTDYDEKIVANNITGNNININTGNDANMVSTNFYNIDGTEKNIKDNDNNSIYLNVNNNLVIEEVKEQHIHNTTKDKWGGNVVRAVIGGAITGGMSGAGVGMGNYAGEYLGAMVSNAVLSTSVNAATSGFTTSLTTTMGNNMSTTVLNGGDLGDVMEAGKETIKDGNTWKTAGASAAIAGASSAILQWSNGTTSLEKGGDAVYKPHESILEEYRERFGREYDGIVDRSANNIGKANVVDNIKSVKESVKTKFGIWGNLTREGGNMSIAVNEIPGMNSMSLMHDFWTNNPILSQTPLLELTIVPAVVVQYCATFPLACGNITTNIMNKNR